MSGSLRSAARRSHEDSLTLDLEKNERQSCQRNRSARPVNQLRMSASLLAAGLPHWTSVGAQVVPSVDYYRLRVIAAETAPDCYEAVATPALYR